MTQPSSPPAPANRMVTSAAKQYLEQWLVNHPPPPSDKMIPFPVKILESARLINQKPIPRLPNRTGFYLPPTKYCLAQDNYTYVKQQEEQQQQEDDNDLIEWEEV